MKTPLFDNFSCWHILRQGLDTSQKSLIGAFIALTGVLVGAALQVESDFLYLAFTAFWIVTFTLLLSFLLKPPLYGLTVRLQKRFIELERTQELLVFEAALLKLKGPELTVLYSAAASYLDAVAAKNDIVAHRYKKIMRKLAA